MKLSTAIMVVIVSIVSLVGLSMLTTPRVTASVPPGTMRRVSSTCDHATCLDVWKDEGANLCFLVAASRNGLAVTPIACPR